FRGRFHHLAYGQPEFFERILPVFNVILPFHCGLPIFRGICQARWVEIAFVLISLSVPCHHCRIGYFPVSGLFPVIVDEPAPYHSSSKSQKSLPLALEGVNGFVESRK